MTKTSTLRRSVLLASIGACAGLRVARAAASAPRTYAVLSLVGDQFTVVTRRRVTGTQLDPNETRPLPVDDAQLDGVAASAVERAIAGADPGAALLRFSIRDKRLFALQERMLSSGSDSDELREALRGLIVKAGATHLVLVTKRREEARFPLDDGSVGAGRISGIGFYIDNLTRTHRIATGESSLGYVSAFAYVSVSLLEAASLRPLGSKHIAESSMTTPADSTDAVVAWEATTVQQKAQALDRVIDRAVFKATRDVLAGS